MVEKVAKMSRIGYIINSLDLQKQLNRKMSALHITLMSIQTSENTLIARMVENFHHAWKEREDKLRIEAEKETVVRNRISEAVLQPRTSEMRKTIAEMAGIELSQLNDELDQVRMENDLINMRLQAYSKSLDTVVRDIAQNDEQRLMNQIIEALNDVATQMPPASAPSLQPIPEECLCPISYSIMEDPVNINAACNHTVSRAAAQRWFDSGNFNCPVCSTPVNSSRVLPNIALRNLIKLIQPH